MTGQKPKTSIRAGQISCALWENEVTAKNGQKVTMLKATVERRYKDSDGRQDIPLVVFCLEKAFEAMIKSDKDGDEDASC